MAKAKQKNKISKKFGKRLSASYSSFSKDDFFQVSDAINLVKSNAKAKFDETIEVAIKLGVDPRHADQTVRGVVAMPHGTGKKVRIAVFAKGEKAEEAKKMGVELVGSDELIEQVKAGNIGFDKCIATPDMMPALSAVAKILGPRGLMPNPKLGTVTMNVGEAIKSVQSGQVEFRVDKAGILHAAFGKASFANEQLKDNLVALVGAVIKAKPSGAKGTYMEKAYLSSTMGIGVRVNMSDLLNSTGN